jgi:acyl carrier protein
MTREDIILAVKDIITTIAPDEELAGLDTAKPLRDQIELDSMDFLDIVMELRKRYSVQVPEEEYGALNTLDGCADYLQPRLEGKELKLVNA